MTNSKIKGYDRFKKLDKYVVNNLNISINYLAINFSIIMLAAYLMSKVPILVIIPILILAVIAYSSFISANRRKYNVLNYFPSWFLGAILALVLLILQSQMPDFIGFKLVISVVFLFHVIIFAISIGTAGEMVDNEKL